jgi:hypothetical protein
MPYTVPEFTAISTCYKPPSVNPALYRDKRNCRSSVSRDPGQAFLLRR